jgi:hypothetical protein
MKVYFKIRNEKGESSKQDQIDYIRHVVEELCKFSKLGLEYKEYVCQELPDTKYTPVVAAYSLKENANFGDLNLAVNKYKLHSKFVIFVAL